ncbi:hypothetical protein OAE17_04415 [Gammaproteobacteria bacterium]|nr:hypothetical protein [Gammaproteobacteria bacterium]
MKPFKKILRPQDLRFLKGLIPHKLKKILRSQDLSFLRGLVPYKSNQGLSLPTSLNFFSLLPRKVLYLSVLPAFLIFLYLSVLGAPKYVSEMSIALNNNDATGSLFGSSQAFLPAGLGADSNIGQLKLFLESIEATSRISSILPLEDLYSKGDILNSLVFKQSDESIHKFRLSNLQITLNTDSSTLIIKAKAFSPKDAFNLNMALIVAMNHYLNRNTRLSNEIIETNKICELQFLRNNLVSDSGIDIENAKELISENNLTSGSDLIFQLTQKRRSNCLISTSSVSSDGIMPSFTSDILFSAYESALKSITASRLEKWNNEESLAIISEPNLPSKPVNPQSFVKSFGFFIVSFFMIYTSTILLRIFREFEL